MEMRKRWHLWLILGVLALTLYNILPTIFFYSQPLDQPVGPETAKNVSVQIAQRVNGLEKEAVSWIKAYSKNLGVKPASIQPLEEDPKLIKVELKSEADAAKFSRFLSRAGALIPFAPAQLSLGPQKGTTVLVDRQVATRFPLDGLQDYFTFAENGSDLYHEILLDRAATLGLAVGGEAEVARLSKALTSPGAPLAGDILLNLAGQIVEFDRTFGVSNPITQRFFGTFVKADALAGKFETLKGEFEKQASGEGERNVRALRRQIDTLDTAAGIIRSNATLFSAKERPLTREQVKSELATKGSLSFGDRNPFVVSLSIDASADRLVLELFPQVRNLLEKEGFSEESHYQGEKLDTLVMNEIARLSRASGEQISPQGLAFAVNTTDLPGSKSFLALDLGAVAEQRADNVQRRLESQWTPQHSDLTRANFPVWNWETFSALSAEGQKLGLLVYAPAAQASAPPEGFRESSIYVIARGFGSIVQKEGSLEVEGPLGSDFQALQALLAQDGFFAYPGTQFGVDPKFKDDLIFELDGYYNDLIAATRENFNVHGNGHWAVLEFTDGRQRLLTTNEIETKVHEDLLKWRDLYQSAQVDTTPGAKFEVPPPTRSVLLDNLALSWSKYFRGDDRKILKWGLDLSGGKSVTIGLQDQNGRAVTETADLNQGINELQSRVNKMGVSEVEIRQEGDNIVLNFPGAQGLSASELVKASTMTFHIMNEKFANPRSDLVAASSRFLQEVWNEAVVTGRKDVDSINEIAFQHLGGEGDLPRSEAAQLLYENDLRLANPQFAEISSDFNDELSAVAVIRGSGPAEWMGQPNPLVFVFANYALEGTNLENVHSAYDPSHGNMLVFGVKSNARDELYTWSSQFAEERVSGTGRETHTGGFGWRMAAILNGEIVSAPVLKGALRDSAQVTGNFSQREVNSLVADLKAGSLSFTPKILSEKNVSPDLGHTERTQGIVATIVGLLLVIAAMAWYYRFAGIIAGCAVLLNLIIMWAVLQNLDAALTLPGIAGIILTVGMAVDANVLVFERVREEFAISKRIASAVQIGYKKAFSAILDSNVTTIIAALILLNFDAGPIKAFAVTLIIGICSSMFTALFMTRYFFGGWVQNPKHRELKMRNLFKKTNFDFLKKAKAAITFSALVIVVGIGLLVVQRHTMFGMDFTGGYALTVQLEEQDGVDYRSATTEALLEAGAGSGDLLVRQLNRPNQLRIQLGMSMEEQGHPFYGLPQEIAGDGAVYSFEHNPRITWVVGALQKAGLELRPETFVGLDGQWNLISGQFSDTMRNSAIWGLGLALLAILIYITVRFEFKYAVSAIVALAHDLLIVVGAMAILHWFKAPVQIDLQVVGALMAIVGYSLNDTIVIFDRIREDGRILRKLSFRELVNSSLNSTLNRTMLTSVTTLLVLLALDLFGGAAIFDFALVMTMGVIFGTFSSLFIASPILLYFHNREQASESHNGRKSA